MAEKRDYYEVLGVERNADAETIKKAYRKALSSITLIRIQVIRRPRRSLRRRQRRTMSSRMRRSVRDMTALVTRV